MWLGGWDGSLVFRIGVVVLQVGVGGQGGSEGARSDGSYTERHAAVVPSEELGARWGLTTRRGGRAVVVRRNDSVHGDNQPAAQMATTRQVLLLGWWDHQES